MKDGKFTDDEIIKVLECCGKGDCENCNHDWSYSAQWDCMRHIERLALDLINRKNDEIERLTNLINELAEANEGLLADNHDLYVRLKNREEEIDRLKEFEHMYNDLCK